MSRFSTRRRLLPRSPWRSVSRNTAPLIIFAGESNSGGTVSNTGISTSARQTVKILNNTSLKFENLQIGVNNLIGHNALTDNASHSWELRLADIAPDVFGDTVYLVKAGYGGSKVDAWVSGNATITTLSSRYSAAVTEMAAHGKTPAVYVWVSIGINDSLAGTASAAFKTSLVRMAAEIRNIVGMCPMFFTLLTTAHSAYDTHITSAVSQILWADTVDTAAANAYLMDAQHWDEGGATLICNRFAELSASAAGMGGVYADSSLRHSATPWVGSGPVWDANAKGSQMSLFYGAQDLQKNVDSGFSMARANVGKSTGKWYCEFKVFRPQANGVFFGVMDDATTSSTTLNNFAVSRTGVVRDDGFEGLSSFSAPGSGGLGTLADNDIVGLAWDADARQAWLSVNNSWLSSGDPAAGTSPYFTWGSTYTIYPACSLLGMAHRVRLLTGSGLNYSPPSGFSSLAA